MKKDPALYMLGDLIDIIEAILLDPGYAEKKKLVILVALQYAKDMVENGTCPECTFRGLGK